MALPKPLYLITSINVFMKYAIEMYYEKMAANISALFHYISSHKVSLSQMPQDEFKLFFGCFLDVLKEFEAYNSKLRIMMYHPCIAWFLHRKVLNNWTNYMVDKQNDADRNLKPYRLHTNTCTCLTLVPLIMHLNYAWYILIWNL